MAALRADLDLRVNTSQVKRSLDKATNEINKIVGKTSGKSVNFNVNEKSFTQPLGRINASANEFTKSLEASNARVIAFGASVAIIDGISDAFKNLVVQATVFEKTLADINAVMSLSSSQLEAFGGKLFDAAQKTAQSFNVAAEAALEFSRQGLSTEEVIRRTNDALILTRLTSLKATDAVAGLTAAVNAFGDAGLTTTDIIDKLSAVDVNFAVSSADLINALQRSGAVAIDAGVELDKLIGIVAALQQTTARGGAVIGNSLKTIFTRIQRPESIKQIEELGIVVRDLTGSILPADKVLLNMAKSFDSLTQAQQSNVVQFSAGIFQANVFRAALKDLSKENSLTSKATEISAKASGEAARKNELLNKTISALASKTGTGIQELAAIMGEMAINPSIGGALDFINQRVDELKSALGGGEDEGSDFAKGLVKGIGNILTGPAVIAFGAIFIKLFMNIAKFAHNSMKDVLGIVGQKEKVKQMEESIVNVLSTNLQIQQGLNNLEGDRAAQEAFILGIIERQTNAMQEQKKLAQSLSGRLLAKGVSPDLSYQAKGTQPVDLDGNGQFDTFTASKGINPEAVSRERMGAIQGGYTPGAVDTTNIKGIGKVVYNKAEEIKQFPGMSQPAIMPPKQSKAGKNYKDSFQDRHGFDPYASGGFIPNFAQQSGGKLIMDKSKLKLFGSSVDIGKAIGMKWTEVQDRIDNKMPVTLESSLEEIIKSSDKDKKQITGKEKLYKTFNAIRGAGIQSIQRDFDVRSIPKKGGRQKPGETGPELAERRAKNLLNAELKLNEADSEYLLSYDPKTKKGVQNYPVDIIAYGEAFPSYEVKSGGFSAANMISKSLRMASDRELEGWMQSQNISRQDLGAKNLGDAQKLAGRLGVKGTGPDGQFTQQDADQWGMSKGLVPNFASIDYIGLADFLLNYEGKLPTYEQIVHELPESINVNNTQAINGLTGTTGSAERSQNAFIKYHTKGEPPEYSEEEAEARLKKIQEKLRSTRVKGYGVQLGIEFENAFREYFEIPKPDGQPHMDFPSPSLSDLDPEKVNKIFLDTHTGGDAFRGKTGHPPTHFVAKYLRQQLDPDNNSEFKLNKGMGQNLKDYVLGTDTTPLKVDNVGGYADIIGINMEENIPNQEIKAEAPLKDVFTKALKLKKEIALKGGYKNRQLPDELLEGKKIQFAYDKDYVSIGFNTESEESASGGFIPNYNLQLGDEYFEKQEVQKALSKLYKNKTGKKLDKRDAEKAAERYTSLIKDSGKTYPGGDFMIGGKKFMANEVALALKNHGQFYRPKEGETVKDFSKGLVPNFMDVVGQRGQIPQLDQSGGIVHPKLNTPDISPVLLEPLLHAKTPDDVARIAENFAKSHSGGALSARSSAGNSTGKMGEEFKDRIVGYGDGWAESENPYSKENIPLTHGKLGPDIASGAVSFTTSDIISRNFTKTKLPTGPDGKFETHEGKIHQKKVPEKLVFGKRKLLRYLNLKSDPPKYPMIDKMKESISSGTFFNDWAKRGGLFLNLDGQHNDRRYIDFKKLEAGRMRSKFGQRMDTIAPHINRKHGDVHTKESEFLQIANDGLVPNFSTKTMVDKETGTSLKYRADKHSPGYADILHSYRGDKDLKGGAFNNFNKLIDKYDSVGSGMLTPQRAGTGPTSWSKIVTMFPQIKNRIQKGLKTRGDFRVDDTEIPFQSLVGLKKSTNKLFRDIPDMEVFLTNFGKQEYFDDGVDFQNLTTSKVKGKGDAAAGFKSKGLIPNFIKAGRGSRHFLGVEDPSGPISIFDKKAKRYKRYREDENGEWQTEWFNQITGTSNEIKEFLSWTRKSQKLPENQINSLEKQVNESSSRYKEGYEETRKKVNLGQAGFFAKKAHNTTSMFPGTEKAYIRSFVKNDKMQALMNEWEASKKMSMYSQGLVPNFALNGEEYAKFATALSKFNKDSGVSPPIKSLDRNQIFKIPKRKKELSQKSIQDIRQFLSSNYFLNLEKGITGQVLSDYNHLRIEGLPNPFRPFTKFSEDEFAGKINVARPKESFAANSGHIPNFSDPLSEAVNRERAAGLPDSKIRIEKSAQLKSPLNPMGLAVTNTRDEPAGVQQGIRRAKSMGIDPKKHGASKGLVPNYAYDGEQYEGFKLQGSQKGDIEKASQAAKDFTSSLKAGKDAVDSNTEAQGKSSKKTKDSDDGKDKRMKVEMDGLQKLFYMQSAISMANGFLQQFAETGNSTVKTLSEVGMAASSVASTFLAAKEASNQLFEMAGVDKREGVSLFNQTFTDPNDPTKKQTKKGLLRSIPGIGGRGKGMMGGLGSAMKGIASLGAGLLKFAPVIGQLTTGATLANEAFKGLTKLDWFRDTLEGFGLSVIEGEGFMGLLSNQSEIAAKNIEKLSKSTEALENGLASLTKQTEVSEKIQELEHLGAKRTSKQDEDLYKLKMESLDIEAKVQKSMSNLFDKNIMGTEVAGELQSAFSKSGSTVENQTKIIKKLITAQKTRLMLEEGATSFGKLIDEEFDQFFSSLDKQDKKLLTQATQMRSVQIGRTLANSIVSDEDLTEDEKVKMLNTNMDELTKVAEKLKTNTIGRTEARKQLSENLQGGKNLGSAIMAKVIDGMINTVDDAKNNPLGLTSFESKTSGGGVEQISQQFGKAKKGLEDQLSGKDIGQTTSEIMDEYKRILSESKTRRDQIIHESKLQISINESHRKIQKSLNSSLLNYEAISKHSALNMDLNASISSEQEKFKDNLLNLNKKTIDSLSKITDTQINAQGMSSVAKTSSQGYNDLLDQEFKKDSVSGITGTLDEKTVNDINRILQEVREETRELKDNNKKTNLIQQKITEQMEPIVHSALSLYLSQSNIYALSSEAENNLKEILSSYKREKETLTTKNKLSLKSLRSDHILNQIKDKTVIGANELRKQLEASGNLSKSIKDNLAGEAYTLQVINDFNKKRLGLLLDSQEFDEKAKQTKIQKNQTEAESALESLRQLQFQVSMGKDDQATKIIREAKFKNEILSAKLSADEAGAREIFLKDQGNRRKLIESQLKEESASLKTTTRNNIDKLKLEVTTNQLKKNADLQIEEDITGAQRSALINAEKSLILSQATKQGELLSRANELQESSNKLTEMNNAIKKAGASRREIDLSVGTSIGTERAQSIRSTREAASKSLMTGSPEDALAFAQSLQATNKELGNGTRALDTLRVKMAEIDVSAKNLGSDLVTIGIDETRSGMKQLFKDMVSGGEDASQAWKKFSLGIAEKLMDRIMDHQIDSIISDLTYAFTGQDNTSEAQKIAGSNNHLIKANAQLESALKALTYEVSNLKGQVQEDVGGRDTGHTRFQGTTGDTKPGGLTPLRQTEEVKVYEQSILERRKKQRVQNTGSSLGDDPLMQKILKVKPEESQKTVVKPTEVTEASALPHPLESHFKPSEKVETTYSKPPPTAASRNASYMQYAWAGKNILPVKSEDSSPEKRYGGDNGYGRRKNSKIGTKKQEQEISPQIQAAQVITGKGIENGENALIEQNGKVQVNLETLATNLQKFNGDTATVSMELANALRNLQQAVTSTGENISQVNDKLVSTIPQNIQPNKNAPSVQHLKDGGFVKGPPGVDNVPAMLTAGEFVLSKNDIKKIEKDASLKFDEGGKAPSRFMAGARGSLKAGAMALTSQAIANNLFKKKDNNPPPKFDKTKLKEIGMGSDVSMQRGDPRLSSRHLVEDPVMKDYKSYLMEKAAYDVQKKNAKYARRSQTARAILGTITSAVVAGATSVIKEPLKKLSEKGKNFALGSTGLHKDSKLWKNARKVEGLEDVNLSQVSEWKKSGDPFDYGGKTYAIMPQPDGSNAIERIKTQTQATQLEKSKPNSFAGINQENLGFLKGYNEGGSIPAMLTAGEAVIPQKVASKIGYDYLDKINKTGSLPIVEGEQGIDKVGPVGLSPGDFVIRKSSTQSMLKDNPNMMRFAMQNPDGFKRAAKGYYSGGIVNKNSESPLALETQKPQAVNRVEPFLNKPEQKANAVSSESTQQTTNNINVNVTLESSGQEKVAVQGAGGNAENEQELALKIKSKVLEVIREEKRIGGELS